MAMALVKPVVRVVVTTDKKTLVVKMAPEGIYFKEPRQRWASALLCPWGVAWVRSAWLAAEQHKRERAAARQAKRAARSTP